MRQVLTIAYRRTLAKRFPPEHTKFFPVGLWSPYRTVDMCLRAALIFNNVLMHIMLVRAFTQDVNQQFDLIEGNSIVQFVSNDRNWTCCDGRCPSQSVAWMLMHKVH